MEQQLKSIIAATANDTLEKLAFLFAFTDDEWSDDQPESMVTGRVAFNGHFSGFLMIQLSTEVIPELACNMLGLDDEDEISDAEQQDALKEILNVICGNVLPAISGDQVEFNIDAPEILTLPDAVQVRTIHKPASAVRLNLEEGVCDLFFFVDGDIPEIAIQSDAETFQLSPKE